jgi:hypothetical protein
MQADQPLIVNDLTEVKPTKGRTKFGVYFDCTGPEAPSSCWYYRPMDRYINLMFADYGDSAIWRQAVDALTGQAWRFKTSAAQTAQDRAAGQQRVRVAS